MLVAWIGTIAFVAAIVLNVLIVLGFPLGEFSMGGKYKVFPKPYRIAGVISIFIQLYGLIVLLQLGEIYSIGLSESIVKGSGWIFGVYLCINTVLNFFSESKKEKYVMTPTSIIMAVCFFIVTMSY